jgi:hypothetical protein
MMVTQVETTQYESAHWQGPKGRGQWAFDIGGRVYFLRGAYEDCKGSAERIALLTGVSFAELLP